MKPKRKFKLMQQEKSLEELMPQNVPEEVMGNFLKLLERLEKKLRKLPFKLIKVAYSTNSKAVLYFKPTSFWLERVFQIISTYEAAYLLDKKGLKIAGVNVTKKEQRPLCDEEITEGESVSEAIKRNKKQGQIKYIMAVKANPKKFTDIKKGQRVARFFHLEVILYPLNN